MPAAQDEPTRDFFSGVLEPVQWVTGPGYLSDGQEVIIPCDKE